MKLPRTIRNCRAVIESPCPRQWDELAETSEPSVRHCASCNREVFFCASDEETIAHARAGDCVAREVPDSRNLGPSIIGRPTIRQEPTPDQAARRLLMRREGSTTYLLGTLPTTSETVPRATIPSQTFAPRASCAAFRSDVPHEAPSLTESARHAVAASSAVGRLRLPLDVSSSTPIRQADRVV